MKKQIKLMAEYYCSPLWLYDESGDLYDEPLPSQLGLPLEIVNQLNSWSDAYNRTFNKDYPPLSGFSSPEDAENFENQGLKLWQELQIVLGNEYTVIYRSVKQGKTLFPE